MSLTIHTGSGFRFIIPSHKIAIIVYCQTSLLNSSSTPFRRLQMLNYYDICKLIEAIHPDLEAAWRLKDDVVDFYNENTIDTAEAALNELIQKFYRSGIPEMIKFGRTLRNWKQEIINSFTVVGVRHKVDKETGQVVISEVKLNTNISETKNSIIKTLKKSANGYACWPRFRNRCLYILRPSAKPILNPLPPIKKVYR